MQSIVLQNISKKIGGRVLFDDVTATFSAGNRYGLTGPNGAGKSTLMKIIMGVEEPTTGSVTLPSKVGYLRQDIEHFHSFRVLDTVIMGNQRLAQTLQERDKLYEQEITTEIGMRLGELEGIIAEEDGYTAETDAEILLIGSGIPIELHQEYMKNIPTDLQFRVLVCQALFGKPEALLLDEPTNHLDMDSIGWLETFLSEYRGVCIVISHDRHFLNTVTTHIADIDYDTIIIYPGNYDAMVVAKTSVRERAEDLSKSREKKISQLKEFVAKFSAGTRASQVQSRLREISKLQPQELKKSNIQRPYINFPIDENNQPGRVIFKIDNLSKAYADNEYIIKNFSLEVLKHEKIGIIGHNGQGKSTLIKMLADKLTPSTGSIELGHNVQIGYFPQNHDDVIDKREKISLFDWLKQRHPKIYDQEIRSTLGKMLFSGEDAFKEIGSLSGGETARLLLGNLILQSPNTLLLDEPNNHLDLEAVSALGVALAKYPGTAIIVSHDRDLLDQFATKLIILEDHKVQVFSGGLEEYFSTLV